MLWVSLVFHTIVPLNDLNNVKLNTNLRSTFLDIHVITNKCSSLSFVPSQLAQNKRRVYAATV